MMNPHPKMKERDVIKVIPLHAKSPLTSFKDKDWGLIT